MKREEVIAAADRYEMPAYPRIDLVAEKGEGTTLFDVDGTEYLDLYAGHAVAILGHSPTCVTDAIAAQSNELLFYSNVVHSPSRARASERLCRLSPWDDAQAFFVNSGAEANETALKIAAKATGRTGAISFLGGFHGRTQGVLSICGMKKYRELATDVGGLNWLAEFNGPLDRFEDPNKALDLGRSWVEAYITDQDGNRAHELALTAAVIVEPIQSMGGMRTMTPEFAQALRKKCDEHGTLLIFDEVQTAPARTGHWFAGERWGVTPDIITTAKGIASGFPAGVVLASGDVAKTVEAGDQGTTFGGGPVACAAIDATLTELERIDGPRCAKEIEACVREGLPGREILGHGAMLGIRVPGPEVTKTLREKHRVLVGGCPGDTTVIRIFPPLNITDDDLERGLAAIRSVLA